MADPKQSAREGIAAGANAAGKPQAGYDGKDPGLGRAGNDKRTDQAEREERDTAAKPRPRRP